MGQRQLSQCQPILAPFELITAACKGFDLLSSDSKTAHLLQMPLGLQSRFSAVAQPQCTPPAAWQATLQWSITDNSTSRDRWGIGERFSTRLYLQRIAKDSRLCTRPKGIAPPHKGFLLRCQILQPLMTNRRRLLTWSFATTGHPVIGSQERNRVHLS